MSQRRGSAFPRSDIALRQGSLRSGFMTCSQNVPQVDMVLRKPEKLCTDRWDSYKDTAPAFSTFSSTILQCTQQPSRYPHWQYGAKNPTPGDKSVLDIVEDCCAINNINWTSLKLTSGLCIVRFYQTNE
ncbi:hypothetical protein Anapl_18052 [Anas platyrhynchos]|uniref:Uncharacterized protein n=1 Tax=Anas platyrhynchos TaxID=8839 RepID=R0KZ72_ANAPL|nr:hypothetical protein Anapl_18052 [Anas platyrhynchos]